MTKTEIEILLPWRSVTTDAVEYDPLTGNYRYTEPAVKETYNPFWTSMGQPRRNPIEDKEKSPRKEKKKKKKPK
jgi:hypothetical protein